MSNWHDIPPMGGLDGHYNGPVQVGSRVVQAILKVRVIKRVTNPNIKVEIAEVYSPQDTNIGLRPGQQFEGDVKYFQEIQVAS